MENPTSNEQLMQNPIIDELLNRALTPKNLMKLAKHIRDYKALLTVLQNHPNIDFEALEASGTRLRFRDR